MTAVSDLAQPPQAQASGPIPGRSQRRPAFVGGSVFRKEAFGRHHPLSISRHAGVMDLCEILGWCNPSSIHECAPASERTLLKFHDAAYVEALRNATRGHPITAEDRERFGFGTMENPIFEGLFERAASTVGGSILAARLALDGRVAFHPAGGTHHGRPDRASGFCYFNDPVFAILTLLEEGAERVLYVDLDAHHGDGVQAAFEADARVMTVSIHERDRWPFSGAAEDRGQGRARNFPVPPGFNDSELRHLLDRVLLALLDRFEPAALVLTCGADGLHGDPLSRMALSNTALWDAVTALVERSPASVVLGGGGYNPWTTIRCWVGLWGRLAGRNLPPRLPEAARRLLDGLDCDLVDDEDRRAEWFDTLADAPRPGPVRDEVRQLAGP